MKVEDQHGIKHSYQISYTVEMFLDTDMLEGNTELRECFTR